jgi:hypothetical protein
LKFGSIFRRSLKIELRQSLKRDAFFGSRKPGRAIPKIVPRPARSDKAIRDGICYRGALRTHSSAGAEAKGLVRNWIASTFSHVIIARIHV